MNNRVGLTIKCDQYLSRKLKTFQSIHFLAKVDVSDLEARERGKWMELVEDRALTTSLVELVFLKVA